MILHGLQRKIQNIVQCCLSNKTQQVKVGKTRSSNLITGYDVPQGTILGPMLFILYINEVSEVTSGFHSTVHS